MLKENEKKIQIKLKLVNLTNSNNDAAPSGGHLAYLCKRHRKEEIYRATSLSDTITDPC